MSAGLSDAKARLDEFVRNRPEKRGPDCETCILPADIRAAIHESRRAGSRYSTLSAFLKSEGHDITTSQLGHHFRNHADRQV